MLFGAIKEGLFQMSKTVTIFLVILTICSLSLTLVSGALSQDQKGNIKILDYSYYIDSLGLIVVVGEVQNQGTNTVTSVILTGSIVSRDGIYQSSSYTIIGIPPAEVTYLNSQQKAPFYMDFYPPQNSPDGSWNSIDIGSVNLQVAQANATASYQYPDLTITGKQSSIGSTTTDKGVFWVNGDIQNTGSQTASNITVFGTFYNSTGATVAVGYGNTVASLSSSGSASFKLGAFDLNQTGIPASKKITDYSLLINVQSPIFQGTAPVVVPTASPVPIINPSPTSTSPSTNPSSTITPTTSQSSSDSTGSQITPTWIYAVIIVIAIAAVVAGLLMLSKRKSK
jgi:hypothetical protein